MKSTSHYAMAHLLHTSLKDRGIKLNLTAFVYGNIAPDYIPSVICAPHFTKACQRGIKFVTARLARHHISEGNPVDAVYSKKLGMLCHYLCDYFCFAHNKDFVGNVKDHIAYEMALDTYLRKWVKGGGAKDESLQPNQAYSLQDYIETEKSSYLAETYSFKNDLEFSFKACLTAVLCMLEISSQYANPDEIDFADDLCENLTLTSAYVYKMFFYKHGDIDLSFMYP